MHVTAMKNINLRLYLVTDENCMPPGRELFHAVEEALQAGVTLVQYREKNGLGRSMLEKAIALRRLCHRYNVPLLVNDRLDIALLSGVLQLTTLRPVNRIMRRLRSVLQSIGWKLPRRAKLQNLFYKQKNILLSAPRHIMYRKPWQQKLPEQITWGAGLSLPQIPKKILCR